MSHRKPSRHGYLPRAIALAVLLSGQAALAQPAPSRPSPAAARLGTVAPAPALVEVAPERVRMELQMLQTALEAYRGAHYFRYPNARTFPELVALLERTEDLPEGFATTGAIEAFHADRNGYQVTESVQGASYTIQTPERYNPFWAFIWGPPGVL